MEAEIVHVISKCNFHLILGLHKTSPLYLRRGGGLSTAINATMWSSLTKSVEHNIRSRSNPHLLCPCAHLSYLIPWCLNNKGPLKWDEVLTARKWPIVRCTSTNEVLHFHHFLVSGGPNGEGRRSQLPLHHLQEAGRSTCYREVSILGNWAECKLASCPFTSYMFLFLLFFMLNCTRQGNRASH